ncbi:MAG TPA: hypothetical protein PLS90_10715 [Candidatus Sumerlaeota bacterium]|nr:hypothetical protein [Candidatus Sumerlaeota bacterium]HOR29194.1 hypothetical protein [Candidatus Sumerlaeota bacterium]HPK02915.1 hypothetical protein [Candidatus Sumerlaeota bacterium]
MNRAKHIQQNVVKRFTEQQMPEVATRGLFADPLRSHPDHLRQFLTMAENRRRQILERMLME